MSSVCTFEHFVHLKKKTKKKIPHQNYKELLGMHVGNSCTFGNRKETLKKSDLLRGDSSLVELYMEP